MMIKTLVENTALSSDFRCEHGLSLYIQTKKHKLLFDMGKTDLFLENAKKMGVNLAQVDIAIISHGHYDHGGGLKAFLEENQNAKIYIHEKAFEQHLSKRPNGILADIGLGKSLMTNNRIVFVNDYLCIDDELELFSNIGGNELCPSGNQLLYMCENGVMQNDTFAHEQNLIITQDNQLILFAGCAHRGIINIVKQAIGIKKRQMDIVIGGFHLYNQHTQESEPDQVITELADYFMQTKSQYYTCHCTGTQPYEKLKGIMKAKINYLSTGATLCV